MHYHKNIPLSPRGCPRESCGLLGIFGDPKYLGLYALQHLGQESAGIAASHSVEEIYRYIEADSLAYLSVEGMRHKSSPVFSVQFHPEAAPGPHDSYYIFGKFVEMMKGSRSFIGGSR